MCVCVCAGGTQAILCEYVCRDVARMICKSAATAKTETLLDLLQCSESLNGLTHVTVRPTLCLTMTHSVAQICAAERDVAAVMEQLVWAYAEEYLPNLKRLSLDGNIRVSSIPPFLKKMRGVEEVHISGLVRPQRCVCRVMDSLSLCNYSYRRETTGPGFGMSLT